MARARFCLVYTCLPLGCTCFREYSRCHVTRGCLQSLCGYVHIRKSGMVAHICYPSTQETQTGESQQQGHPQLHKESKASLGYLKSSLNKSQSIAASRNPRKLGVGHNAEAEQVPKMREKYSIKQQIGSRGGLVLTGG